MVLRLITVVRLALGEDRTLSLVVPAEHEITSVASSLVDGDDILIGGGGGDTLIGLAVTR